MEGIGLSALTSPSTPPYQRLQQVLQTDARCSQEVFIYFYIKKDSKLKGRQRDVFYKHEKKLLIYSIII